MPIQAQVVANYLISGHHFMNLMKDTIFDIARKWGVGVCLLLWCCLTYLAMAVPAALLLLLLEIGVPPIVVKFAVGIYAVLGVPLVAYEFGRAFGLRYDKITTQNRDAKI